ncbi:Histone-lysine N-methyltransferase SETMAR [Eumeta japonica]|uniref:Histone-lysine N-methyltransferase SETMAR n=1 Tax=Eumeta variegata TaxID=151549 RepID=A0A4C1V800_EUMVA|nr:Histone-lysine N-methyltransferase SETMAR [Eumeta japonica]
MSAESSNLSNIEHRAVIKYFVKKGKTPKEFFEDMVSVLQESAPRRPVTVVTEENVRKIEKLVLAGQRIKLWKIAEELQISKERVGEIIHEHINMRKISARWVPKMLTPFDKQRRLQTSNDFLELVGDNIDEICDRIITVDETWFVNTIRNLNRSPCNGRKRKAEEIQGSKSASKLMATIFGIVKAREAVVQKRRGKLSRGVLFLQDNASDHTARVSRQALKDTGFSEIDHPPYSPDLAPSDYFLFSNLKKELRGRRFVDDNQMKMAIESHFDCKEKEYFLGSLKISNGLNPCWYPSDFLCREDPLKGSSTRQVTRRQHPRVLSGRASGFQPHTTHAHGREGVRDRYFLPPPRRKRKKKCIRRSCTPAATCEARAVINKSEHRNAVHHFDHTPQESVLRDNYIGNPKCGLTLRY